MPLKKQPPSSSSTLGAIEAAVARVASLGLADEADDEDRLVIVVSDANFRRYGITPEDLNEAMRRDSRVRVHLVLIASLADEAAALLQALPLGTCHICLDSALLPTVIRQILSAGMSD
jgi:hypothetical protein